MRALAVSREFYKLPSLGLKGDTRLPVDLGWPALIPRNEEKRLKLVINNLRNIF